ncbi:FAD-dependent monooxygenase [Micromonospora zhanjiangensis]
MSNRMAGEVAVVGAGIGGLVLALELHDAGIPCRIYEAVPEIRPLGVGINILPHATGILARLGLTDDLARVAVTTRESAFFNRFGQLIHREPAGRYAGHEHPQFSVHRGDLQRVLLDAVRARLGPDAVRLDHRCVGFDQDRDGVRLRFRRSGDGASLPDVPAALLVGCDGIHSAVRAQLHPGRGSRATAG